MGDLVYRAHKRIGNWGFEFESISEIESFIEVNRDTIIQFTQGEIPRVKETNGRKAYVSNGDIFLPKMFWNQLILCHEIAHIGHEDEKPMHGKSFLWRELRIVSALMGAWHTAELKKTLEAEHLL